MAKLCLFTILTTGIQAQNLPAGQEASDLTEAIVLEKPEVSNEDVIVAGDANPSVPVFNAEPAAPEISRAAVDRPATLLIRQPTSAPEILRIQTNPSVQKRNGLIMAGVGVAAIVFGAVTYSMLNKDHKDYKNIIADAEGLPSYASPGIYVSGGAAVAGLGLSLASIPKLLKGR